MDLSRRHFLGQVAFGAAAFTTPGLFAEELIKTPEGGEGPFYPDKLPLDTDNDLLIINDKITPAVGKITHLRGRVLDQNGKPVRGAVVEIWQADASGCYIHSKSANKEKEDGNFQGYGRFLTGSKGEYYFRTIRPVRYPGRAPHIHFIVKQGEKRLVTSQFYISDQKEANAKDFLYKKIKTEKERKLVTLKFKPVKKSKIGELSAKGNIIVGVTPEDVKEV